MTNPSGRVTMTTTSKSVSRLRIYNYGEHPNVANEGDLLIVSENTLGEAGQGSHVEFELTIRGRDITAFQRYVDKAVKLWDENKDYLLQPATRVISNPALRTIGLLDDLRKNG